ncbi:DUF4337 domain-containing protein [Acetobacteraceae bacterium KSS8]|uniref:DUF4337 domain-containing protein n=1 Tax=Endosaccharibacter trunci TaxID=2812733 RepID=A0ABT1W6G3_9PROT|nr:DUF4337 domain-containing protein [Acetobacteraceae bacterium KSS8]
MAQDSLEHAHGHQSHHQDGGPATLTRAAAVLVAVIAAVAVVVEMTANDRQTAYLAHDVAASDLWSQYQGKSVRRAVMEQSALLLEAETGVPGADPARTQKLEAEAAAARAAAAKLQDDDGGHDGMRQIAAHAAQEERARDAALEQHENYERSVRGLQIAIVLIGLFMATRLVWLLGVGSVLGAVALVYAVLSGLSLV